MDFATKSAAEVKSIPLADAKSRVASVAFFNCSSSLINAASIAWAFMIASSPNLVWACNAEA